MIKLLIERNWISTLFINIHLILTTNIQIYLGKEISYLSLLYREIGIILCLPENIDQ